MFIIEDDLHAEVVVADLHSMEEALKEIYRLANVPWNQKPNLCPCSNWQHCGRKYEIVEYGTASTPWSFISRTPIVEINSNGVHWDKKYKGS